MQGRILSSVLCGHKHALAYSQRGAPFPGDFWALAGSWGGWLSKILFITRREGCCHQSHGAGTTVNRV